MIKRHLLVLLVMALIGVACGGGAEDTNPAAFGDKGGTPPAEVCQEAPVTVPGISVNGQRVKGISNVEVCVRAGAEAGIIPVVKEQPQCGDPCLTVELTGLNVNAEAGVTVRMTRDNTEHEEIKYDIDPVNVGNANRWCVVGIGTPDPCVDRITTPTSLTAKTGKAAGVVKLAWGASTSTGDADVTGYEVYRSETGEAGSFIPVASATGTSHKETGLVSGTTYYYYVIALDGNGNHSEASNVAQATAK